MDHAASGHDTTGTDEAKKAERKRFWVLLIGCIGVVYGDIGTSPLYAFREAAHQVSSDGLHTHEIYGILSLIIWALIIIVTLKYVLFLLRADNKGEGGILALMTLVRRHVVDPKRKDIVLFTGAVGIALFYGDAAITPAISVMSAIEGLKLVTPLFERYVLSLSVFIIWMMFSFQKFGTHKVSAFFGPVTVLWFSVMALTGASWIIAHPSVIFSLSPHYAILFLIEHGGMSFLILGSVFLAITGAEALYADMGHFGIKPIQRAWLFFIFPCLILNYMGQASIILEKPAALENPFFLMVPSWGLLPMVLLATCATIIASQAVITGAFSLTRQAIQLGLLPRMEIRFTSEDHAGQIYMPRVNNLLRLAVLFLCVLFQSSGNLAAAYGIAVSGDMVITSCLALFLVMKVWKKSLVFTLLFVAPFLIIEIIFLCSNMTRVFDGGIVPLFFAAYMTLLMVTWVYGSRYLARKAEKKAVRITDFSEQLDQIKPHVVKGTAIYFTSEPSITPEAFLKNLKYNQIIHEQNVIVTVVTSSFPKVTESQRVQISPISSRLTRVIVHFGFMETPDLVQALTNARWQGFEIDIKNAIFFFARRKIVSDPRRGLPEWQDKIYIGLSRSAIGEHDFFKLPRTRVVELGVQVTI